MANYNIDDGHSNLISAGLSEHNVWQAAQRIADERGETVYVYEVGSELITDVDPQVLECGTLMDYRTGEELREATADETRASIEAAERDGGAGVIEVSDRPCYVEGGKAWPRRPDSGLTRMWWG